MAKKMDNLTACAVAARAAGKSYGRYMADHYEEWKKRQDAIEEEHRKTKAAEIERMLASGEMSRCRQCKRAFVPVPHNAVYCSDACRCKKLGPYYGAYEMEDYADGTT